MGCPTFCIRRVRHSSVLHASCRDQCAGMVESKDQLHPYLWSVFFLNGFTTNGAAILIMLQFRIDLVHRRKLDGQQFFEVSEPYYSGYI